MAYVKAGRADRSVPLFERSAAGDGRPVRGGPPQALNVRAILGADYCMVGRVAEGVRQLEEALGRVRGRPDAAALWPGSPNIWPGPTSTPVRPPRRKGSCADGVATPAGSARTTPAPRRRWPSWGCVWSSSRSGPRPSRSCACLVMREKSQPDDWATFSTRSQLGGCLLGLLEFAAAEPLVVSGYEGLKAREVDDVIPPNARVRLDEATARLVALYEAWGKPERVAAWRSKLSLPAGELPADCGPLRPALRVRGLPARASRTAGPETDPPGAPLPPAAAAARAAVYPYSAGQGETGAPAMAHCLERDTRSPPRRKPRRPATGDTELPG